MLKRITLKQFFMGQIIIFCTIALLVIANYLFMSKSMIAGDEQQTKNVFLHEFMDEKYIDHLNNHIQ